MTEPTPPMPHDGWSKDRLTLDDAVIVPPQESRPRTPSGVWHNGGDVPQAAIWRHDQRMSLALEQEPVPEAELAGTYLFGGMFYGHFGHFITESIARFWAAGPGIDGILFTPKHQTLTHFKKPHRELFKIFGLDREPKVIPQPTRVERLIVPGQGFGLGEIAAGTVEFRDFIGRTVRQIPANGPEKIYISRTRYIAPGGLLAEQVLERNLEAAGYTPVYPETLGWGDQLALYRSARQIISLDTSALHMAGMAAGPDTNIAIIIRRNNFESKSMQTQLESFTGRKPTVINSLTAEYLEGGKRPNHNSWGQADFAEMRARLVETGFINADTPWEIPSEATLEDAVTEAHRRSKKPLVLKSIEQRFG